MRQPSRSKRNFINGKILIEKMEQATKGRISEEKASFMAADHVLTTYTRWNNYRKRKRLKIKTYIYGPAEGVRFNTEIKTMKSNAKMENTERTNKSNKKPHKRK